MSAWKKALLVVAAIALVVWVASWFRSGDAVAVSAAQPWPGNMGTLQAASRRYPPRNANAAAVKLQQLAKPLANDDAVKAFVEHEIARGELATGTPPKLPDVSAIRDLLLHEPIVWERHDGVGDEQTYSARGAQMRIGRALVANALAKAEWEDLHAAWNLALSLDGQPQIMSQTAALSIARMVNAVAWKMPLPAPQWLDDLRSRDYVPRLLEAFQYQAASYCDSAPARLFPTKYLAGLIDHDRRIAEQLASATSCAVTVPPNELGVDLRSIWQRAFRYRAEREATANALRVREGLPIETRSGCSNGTWSFDGSTLRFTDKAMPLELHVRYSAAPNGKRAAQDTERTIREKQKPSQEH